MKKQNVLAALVSLIVLFSFSVNAADRCAGEVSNSLLQAEAVANFYFDMKVHELICTYHLKGPEFDAIAARVLEARTQIKPTLIKSQDQMVAKLGGEGPFETFYARIGNHMSFLNLPNPCERTLELANAMIASGATTKSSITKIYRPFFSSLKDQYEVKAAKVFTRICDPL